MRSFALALAGLAALCHAAPTPDEAKPVKERQFSIGNPSVTLCVGSCKPASPTIWVPALPTGGIHIGRDEHQDDIKRDVQEKRDAIVDDIIETCSDLASALAPEKANSAYQLVIDECLILFQKHDVDFKILGAWSDFHISEKVKRQTGQIIIGSCTEDDVKALVTQFQTIVTKYGREQVPYDIAVLMEAIKAALFYCALASPTTGPFIPPDTVIGNPVTPDPTVPGSPVTPDPSVPGGPLNPDPATPGGPLQPDPATPGPVTPDPIESGGPLIPDKPTPGGGLIPDTTVPGGPLIPDKPVQGGPLVPDKPIKGGPLVPDKPAQGGTVVPDKPVGGGSVTPSD